MEVNFCRRSFLSNLLSLRESGPKSSVELIVIVYWPLGKILHKYFPHSVAEVSAVALLRGVVLSVPAGVPLATQVCVCDEVATCPG